MLVAGEICEKELTIEIWVILMASLLPSTEGELLLPLESF